MWVFQAEKKNTMQVWEEHANCIQIQEYIFLYNFITKLLIKQRKMIWSEDLLYIMLAINVFISLCSAQEYYITGTLLTFLKKKNLIFIAVYVPAHNGSNWNVLYFLLDLNNSWQNWLSR